MDGLYVSFVNATGRLTRKKPHMHVRTRIKRLFAESKTRIDAWIGSRIGLITCKVLAAILLAVTAMIWARFFSWGFLSPWHQTKVSLPLIPALGILFTVLWLLFDKSDFLDRVRQQFDAWVARFGAVILLSLTVVLGSSMTMYMILTPPQWKTFLDRELLSGHDDQFYRANLSVSEIKKMDRDTGMLAEVAVRLEELSEDESKWVKVADQEELFTLQKRITSATVRSKFSTILKNFSLANFHNIALDHKAVNAATSSISVTNALDEILNAKRRYTTEKLRNVSAKVSANTHFFAGNMEEAVQRWELLPQTPSTDANLVVGYRNLGEYQTSIQRGLRGLEGYDETSSNAAQTLGSLVANTMTTMMCLDDHRGAIELYEQWYINRGELSDAALVQTYAINLILGERVDDANKLMTSGRMAQDEVEDLLLLILMKEDNYSKAMNMWRAAMGEDADGLSDLEAWERLKSIYNGAGYLGAPRIMDIFERLIKRANQGS